MLPHRRDELNPASQNNSEKPAANTRRDLLVTLGSRAAYVAPATLLLLSSKAKAIS
jgi:hypothetical protein